jgi:hypothetical protein
MAKNSLPLHLLGANRQLSNTSTSASDSSRPAASIPLTPFQAALLFFQHKQHQHAKPVAYAAFFRAGQLVSLEWLHNQRGHSPAVNTKLVIRRAGHLKADQVILATWVRSTAEQPYALEFVDEIDRQHDELTAADLEMVDCLRLSETGMYSYYGAQRGPYAGGDTYHGINLYYR